jgi:hypothetical protein
MKRRRWLAAVALAALIASGLLAVSAPQVVVAQAEPTIADPQLYITPECLSGQTSLAVTGRNFDRNRSVDVWDLYNTTDPLYGNKVTVTSSDYGTLSTTLPIDLHASGYHRVEAVYSDDSYFAPQSILIVGDCDTSITPTPRCTGAPTAVNLALTNWLYESTDPIVIEVTNVDSNATVATASFDATSASFTVTLNLTSSIYPDGLPNGRYRIVAHQGTDPLSTISAFTYLLAPCPTVTVTPNCGANGLPPDQLSLDVTASGFINDPDWLIWNLEIVFDDGAAPQEFSTDAAEPDGTYEITPYARPNGKYAVTVKQGYDAGVEYVTVNSIVFRPAWTGRRLSSATTTFVVPCPVATASPPPTPTPSPSPSPPPFLTTVAVTPVCGAPQIANDLPQTYSLTVTGTGWLPTTVTLIFDPDGSDQVFSAPVAADGTFSTVIMPTALAEGTYTLRASQAVEGNVPDALATFTVPCGPPAPLLTSDLPCADPAAGVPAAYTINLSGSGFYPGRVEVTFDAGGLLPELTVASADATGAFAATLTPTGRSPGTYLIVAQQTVASTNTIVAAPPLAFTVACSGAQLVLSPANGPPGLVVMVEGHDFPADVDIILRWSRGIDAGSAIVAHTDLDGNFSRQVLIFNSDFPGPRLLSVELASDPLGLAIAPAAYFVTPATVSPPFSLSDDPFVLPDATIVFRH